MTKFSQLAAGLGLLAAIAASQSQFGAGAAGLVALLLTCLRAKSAMQ
ncbi:hypothetical protein [Sinorhizobium medicae]|nr:hypothetical protein [Sinorhizobium medicae]